MLTETVHPCLFRFFLLTPPPFKNRWEYQRCVLKLGGKSCPNAFHNFVCQSPNVLHWLTHPRFVLIDGIEFYLPTMVSCVTGKAGPTQRHRPKGQRASSSNQTAGSGRSLPPRAGVPAVRKRTARKVGDKSLNQTAGSGQRPAALRTHTYIIAF